MAITRYLLSLLLTSLSTAKLLASEHVLEATLTSPPQCPPDDLIPVNTTSGLFLGVLQPPYYNITAFLGIPYATPPVGDLRFAAPQPYVPRTFDEATLAGSVSNVCPQIPYHTLLDSKNFPLPESEDCLTVSIWHATSVATEARNNTLLPVLIFIHGGGFTSGGTTPYLGHPIVSQHPDIIVVSINYRLNILGFPNPGPSSNNNDNSDSPITPNAGLHDQRLALQWISNNIASFGGDPRRMTAMGHSAGSQSLAHYSFAHASNPLVQGMILWSGQTEGSLQDRTGVGWQHALARTGCRTPNSSAASELTCLRALPTRQLLQQGVSYPLQIAYTDFTDDGWTPGVPAPDNLTNWDAASGIYIEKALAGTLPTIPTWIQTTTHEADNTVPFNTSSADARPDGSGAINRTQADQVTLAAFQCPAWLAAGLRVAAGPTVFRSVYNGSFDAMRPFPWMQRRAYHGEDVLLLLNELENVAGWWGVVTAEMRVAAGYLRGAVAAFVRDPERGLQGELGWRGYEGGGETVQVLFTDNQPTLDVINATMYDAPCREIWEGVLPPALFDAVVSA